MNLEHSTKHEIDQLLDELEQSEKNDLQAQIAKAEQTLTLSQAIGYERGQSLSYYYIAQTQARLNDFTKAVLYAKQAIEIAQRHQLVVEESFGDGHSRVCVC
ncbi:MAG: hypothetical protein HC899_39280 [Leptolyngbyaceae cyanobacterium SM1_4_3]|nr:hypothetical protein [Leptolyngbyaceae cyanobacterium SM1_4_3]